MKAHFTDDMLHSRDLGGMREWPYDKMCLGFTGMEVTQFILSELCNENIGFQCHKKIPENGLRHHQNCW